MLVILSENPLHPTLSYVEFPAKEDAIAYFPRRIRAMLRKLGSSPDCYVVHRDDFSDFVKYLTAHSSMFEMLPANRLACHYDCKRKYIR